MGGGLTNVVALRAVKTIHFVIVNWARPHYEFLEHLSRRIVYAELGIWGVVYDISGKPPLAIKWECPMARRHTPR